MVRVVKEKPAYQTQVVISAHKFASRLAMMSEFRRIWLEGMTGVKLLNSEWKPAHHAAKNGGQRLACSQLKLRSAMLAMLRCHLFLGCF